MTATELKDRIEAGDRGTAIEDPELTVAILGALLRADLYVLMSGCGAEFVLRPSLTKFDLLQRVRNRLTARERAELRNSC